MKRSAIMLVLSICSAPVFAETIYDGRGDLNKTPAMLSDVLSEVTRLNAYGHGNTLGVASNAGRITVLEGSQVQQDKAIAGKVDRSEFVKDQQRQDAATSGNAKAIAANSATLSSHQATLGQHGRTLGVHSDQISALERSRGEYATRLDNQDAAIVALDREYQGRFADVSAGVDRALDRSERALEGATASLAVAGQQFSTDPAAGVQVAVSAASMSGKQALAIGAGGAVSENLFFNAAISKSGNTTGGVISGTFAFR